MAFQSKNKLLTRLSLQGVILRSVSITFIYLLFYILTETGTIFTRVLFMNKIYLTFRGCRMWCLPATRIYASFRVVVPTHPSAPVETQPVFLYHTDRSEKKENVRDEDQ